MYDTIFPADSVEFCPQEGLHDVFAVGTYKLEEGEADLPTEHQQRRGQCLIFRMNEDESNFEKVQAFDLPAVLDMKWCHRDPATLAVADSESNVTLFRYDTEEKILKHTQTVACTSSTANLCLSLDWSTRREANSAVGSLIVSVSNGSLSLLAPDHTGALCVEKSWHAHEYEPWVAAWNYWDTNVVFSGGDDLKMKGWDVREDSQRPIFTNKKFEAGITSIQSHPHVEHLISVGSYDNQVRLFDTRKPNSAICAVEVGGGAWRVKWHPSPERKNDLLVACMHDGFKVIRFEEEESMISSKCGTILTHFEEHESLAYGVDWSFSPSRGLESVVGSCSFYDHLLHVWKA